MLLKTKNFRRFDKWCQESIVSLELQQQIAASEVWQALTDKNTAAALKEIAARISERLDKNETPLSLNLNSAQLDSASIEICRTLVSTSTRVDPAMPLHFANVKVRNIGRFRIEGVCIDTLSISEPNPHKSIELHNCFIRKLIARQDANVRISLSQCFVGEMILDRGSTKSLIVTGGAIRSITLPPPKYGNPFLGTVSFSKVNFPTNPSLDRLLDGAQGYSNLRAHLSELENVPESNRARTLELRTERHIEEWTFTWLVNWLYEKCANYGLSPGRPIAIILIVDAVVSTILFYVDKGALGLPLKEYDDSWREGLNAPGVCGELARSLFLPIQTIFSPFGGFGTRQLVLAATFEGAVLVTLQGIMTYILLLMTALGIRKRFKLP
jgi:hypothetical protein